MSHLDLNKFLKGRKPINITIDKEAKAIYFKMLDQDVLRTIRINDSVSIDYGKDDDIVGIEIIRIRRIEVILKKALKDISSIIPSKTLAAV